MHHPTPTHTEYHFDYIKQLSTNPPDPSMPVLSFLMIPTKLSSSELGFLALHLFSQFCFLTHAISLHVLLPSYAQPYQCFHPSRIDWLSPPV